MGFNISAQAIREGCKSVFWPGRFEVIARNPTVILDGAHSPASAQALVRTVQEIFNGQKVILVEGFSNDKNIASIREQLEGIAREIILTKADHPRAADLPGAIHVKDAVILSHEKADAQDIILVTGSIFVISEARRFILSKMRMEERRWEIEKAYSRAHIAG
jgi:dihydrofolate synthase/folylpolyglutamate synthase